MRILAPVINGLLRHPSDTEKYHITLTYGLSSNGIITIIEGWNYGEVKELKIGGMYSDIIAGKQVWRNKDGTSYYFRSEKFDFSLSSMNVSEEDVLKTVESIVEQVK